MLSQIACKLNSFSAYVTEDDTLKLKFTPSSETMMARTGGKKLRAIAFSMFRPQVRNIKHQQYYNGLLKAIDKVKRQYKIEDGWILRIFVDDSLFTETYSYNTEYILRAGEQPEHEMWRNGMKNLLNDEVVQIVQFECSKFLNTDRAHHIGYFGASARFYSIFDPLTELTVFRDINKNLTKSDRLSLEKWIASDSMFHFYYNAEGYIPRHYLKFITKIKSKDYDDNYEFLNKKYKSLLAGLWAAKRPNEEHLDKLWCDIVKLIGCHLGTTPDQVLPCYEEQKIGALLDENKNNPLTYGIDEIIMNGPIFSMIKAHKYTAQPIIPENLLFSFLKLEIREKIVDNVMGELKKLSHTDIFEDLDVEAPSYGGIVKNLNTAIIEAKPNFIGHLKNARHICNIIYDELVKYLSFDNLIDIDSVPTDILDIISYNPEMITLWNHMLSVEYEPQVVFEYEKFKLDIFEELNNVLAPFAAKFSNRRSPARSPYLHYKSSCEAHLEEPPITMEETLGAMKSLFSDINGIGGGLQLNADIKNQLQDIFDKYGIYKKLFWHIRT